MRKQSFLSLSVILVLFLSGCTKEENIPNYNPSFNGQTYTDDAYSVSYSDWTTNANLSWSDGEMTQPFRQSTLDAPDLTQAMIDAGVVLVYVKSSVDDSVHLMPAHYFDVNNNETNLYLARHEAGFINLVHTRIVNGEMEVPNDLNSLSFRYIFVNPGTPDPNGRQITAEQLVSMPYKDVVAALDIPE